MSQSIGSVIRRLRKERGLTQEELAELLNVSGQAVSKWENETSLPDISQIVPLAKIFGVSTDVLFDTAGKNDREAVLELLRHADSLLYDEHGIPAENGLYAAYRAARDGLTHFPGHPWLLMYALEKGAALTSPANDGYTPAHANDIYDDCVRMGRLVFTHVRNTTDLLRAHSILLLLHASRGNFREAAEHADAFPERADLTYHQAMAFLAHLRGDRAAEAAEERYDAFYHMEALADSLTRNGISCLAQGRYDDALTAFRAVFDLLALLFPGAEVPPPLHVRESGDVHALLAETHLAMGDTDGALDWLERMVDYEVNLREQFDALTESPLVRDPGGFEFLQRRTKTGRMRVLLATLETFDGLQEHAVYQNLLETVRAEVL